LLELGRELLIDELLPLLPESRHREAHLLATAISIARREAQTGNGPAKDIIRQLAALYALSALQGGEGGDPLRSGGEGEVGTGDLSGIPHLTPALSAPPWLKGGGGGASLDDLLRRFAADLRNGAFERSGPRQNAARAILWALTIAKLREGNPQFLAANGIA
jgi:hypothetical protein